MVYTEQTVGIFIQDIYGNLYTEDEWDGTQTANGVAVIAPECEFVIALLYSGGYLSYWANELETVDGVTTTLEEEEALLDYNGKSNTEAIVSKYYNEDGVAKKASQYIFRFDKLTKS